MVSNNPEIIGIDIETIITFPPISILFAIAVSPESLQILTANSVKNAIPVIFISKVKNVLLIAVLFARLVKSSTTPDILLSIIPSISAPAISDTYITNSGLYCFKIIIIIKAIKPYSYDFYNIHFVLPF